MKLTLFIALAFTLGGCDSSSTPNVTFSSIPSSDSSSPSISSFNTRTGAITLSSGDVIGALTYSPLNKAGDTMTGALTLSGNPTASNHATTKGYVDSVVAGGGGLRAYSSSGVELGKTIILTANSIAVSFFIKMSDGKYARDVSTGNGVGSVYYPTTDCSGSVMYLSTEASMYRPVPPAGALVSANGGPLIDPRWTMSIYKTLPTGDVTHDLGSSPWFEVTSDEDTSLTMGLVLPLMSRKNYTIYQDPVTGVPCETATAADMWIDGSPLVRITPVTVFSSEMLNILEAYGPDGRAQITHESKR